MLHARNTLGKDRCCYIHKNGHTGPQGEPGKYGHIGQMGITGVTGNIGPQGDTGICYRGQKGPTGYRGPQGGFTGDAGFPGLKGEPGQLGQAKNICFEFTIGSGGSYSNSFKELTILSTTILTSNFVSLEGNSNYVIHFEINENWSDPGAQIYIQLYTTNPPSNYTYPFVFNPTNQSQLVLTSYDTKTRGIGNDVINITNGGVYSVLIFQQSVSNNVINIEGKKVKFSITFVKIS